MKKFSLLSVIRDKAPGVCLDSIIEFEKSIGIALPNEYRDFLMQTPGGDCTQFVTYQRDAQIDYIAGLASTSKYPLTTFKSIYGELEYLPPSDLLCFMGGFFGDFYCIGLKGARRGKVFRWVRGAPPFGNKKTNPDDGKRRLELLANSFNEFLRGVLLYPKF